MVTSNENISKEAVSFFANHFRDEESLEDFNILYHIPKLISDEKNMIMNVLPKMEEVKAVVFELNRVSTSCPDSFLGYFFLSCWDIVGSDITDMVKVFFFGHRLVRFVTYTNLVLIPKKESIRNFGDIRHISLTSQVFMRGW